MQRERSWLGIVDWKERGSPRIRPRDKGMTTRWLASELAEPDFSAPVLVARSFFFLFFFFFLFSGWKAHGRKREADVGMRNRGGRLYIFTGPFVSRGPSCCAPWDLSGENCLLGTTTTNASPLIETSRGSVSLIADPALVVPAMISLLIPRLRGYLNCSPRRLWYLNLGFI